MNLNRRELLEAGGVCAVALAASAVNSPALAQAKTAKIGHLEAPTQPRHRGLEKVAKLVLERTNGAVDIKLFPAAQLGNARQQMEGTQFGSQECTVMPAAFTGGFNPVISALDIPFLFPDDRAKSNELRDGPFGKFLVESFNSRGFVGTGLWANGRKCVTSRRPLNSAADFKGQKFRVMDSKILMEQFAGVGASAVAINFSEVYTALQTGLVDGQENPLDSITTMKFFEVQKYLVKSDHGVMEDAILFNPAWWNGLTAAQRDAIVKTFNEVRPEVEAMKEAAQVTALETIRKAGLDVRVLSPEERAEWRKLMHKPAVEAYLQRAGAEGKKAMELYAAEAKRLGIAA